MSFTLSEVAHVVFLDMELFARFLGVKAKEPDLGLVL